MFGGQRDLNDICGKSNFDINILFLLEIHKIISSDINQIPTETYYEGFISLFYHTV